MATIKQAQRVDRSKLEPIDAAMPVQNSLPNLATGVSPFMMCSLPPRAATLDQFQRQFYNRNTLPQQRILTPNLT